MTSKTCINCSVPLISGVTWSASRVRKNDYICSHCNAIRRHKPDQYGATSGVREAHAVEGKAWGAIKSGYVYVMINPAFPGWSKVGCAVSMQDRENNYQTGDPFRQYSMVGGVYTEDRELLEALAHDHCESSAAERRGEWFKINEMHALNIIRLEARELTKAA